MQQFALELSELYFNFCYFTPAWRKNSCMFYCPDCVQMTDFSSKTHVIFVLFSKGKNKTRKTQRCWVCDGWFIRWKWARTHWISHCVVFSWCEVCLKLNNSRLQQKGTQMQDVLVILEVFFCHHGRMGREWEWGGHGVGQGGCLHLVLPSFTGTWCVCLSVCLYL